MKNLERCHQAAASVRSSLRAAYEAADRLCTTFMRAKNDATDQGALDKATRRLYGALHELEAEVHAFNADCVRLQDGTVLRDGNGTAVGLLQEPGSEGEPGGTA